jgi:hypothetical protein
MSLNDAYVHAMMDIAASSDTDQTKKWASEGAAYFHNHPMEHPLYGPDYDGPDFQMH